MNRKRSRMNVVRVRLSASCYLYTSRSIATSRLLELAAPSHPRERDAAASARSDRGGRRLAPRRPASTERDPAVAPRSPRPRSADPRARRFEPNRRRRRHWRRCPDAVLAVDRDLQRAVPAHPHRRVHGAVRADEHRDGHLQRCAPDLARPPRARSRSRRARFFFFKPPRRRTRRDANALPSPAPPLISLPQARRRTSGSRSSGSRRRWRASSRPASPGRRSAPSTR